jgi:hypothetical protein
MAQFSVTIMRPTGSVPGENEQTVDRMPQKNDRHCCHNLLTPAERHEL